MAFIVEIALSNARKDDSEVQIKDKKDLVHALKNRETLTKILEQANEVLKSTEYLRNISDGQNYNFIVDYFMEIMDKVNVKQLRFY
ncbi:MAG: hypothetical protein ACRD5J_19195 [Nitrososphaeraceae archaeon]